MLMSPNCSAMITADVKEEKTVGIYNGCPIIKLYNGSMLPNCERSACAWYDCTTGRCTIKNISDALQSIAKSLKEQKGEK